MQKFFDNVVDKNGHVLAGASVTVTDAATGALSTIYSNNSLGIKANPITCDSNGYFEFYAANGRYTLTVTGGALTTRVVQDVLLEDITGTGADLVGFTPAGTGAVSRSSQDKMREVQINAKDYGAKVDGVTDDYAAVVNLLAWASVLGGGVVDIPAGTCMTGTQILVPANTRIRGAGKRTSTIKATASFPTTDAVIRLGTTSAFAFDCRVEDMAIHCNSVAPIGITGTCIQEGSGARNVLVTWYTATGIELDETAGTLYCDHYLFDDIELSCASTATATQGFHYKGGKNGGQIRRMTVNPNGTTTQNYGVHIEGTSAAGCHVQVIGLNVERHSDAVFVDTNGGATVIGATLLTAGTNLVRIASGQAVEVIRAYRAVGTNTINNTNLGETITDQSVSSYFQVWSGNGTQSFYMGGRTGTTGSVTGPDNPVHTVKTLSTSTGTQKCRYRLLDGLNNGWALQFAGNGLNHPFELIPITAGADGSVMFRVTNLGGIQGLATTNGPTGTLTLAAAATTTVSNTSVTTNSKAILFPTNAAAATLMQGTKALYHDIASNSSGGSFTVKTADATAAAGTETFTYWLVN